MKRDKAKPVEEPTCRATLKWTDGRRLVCDRPKDHIPEDQHQQTLTWTASA